MPELRWALIGLGVVFLVGLGLWEWVRGRRHPRSTGPQARPGGQAMEWTQRVEPSLEALPEVRPPQPEDTFDVPVMHASARVPVLEEVAVDLPAAARTAAAAVPVADAEAEAEEAPVPARKPASAGPVSIQWPPVRTDRVLTLRVLPAGSTPLAGRAVRIALESAGLTPGPQTIYHRADAGGAVVVSAANLVRPGSLDPEQLDHEELRGLSLFSVLPGPLPPPRMLEELVATARVLAHRLGAVVQDERGEDLDGVRLTALRRSLSEGAAGDGQAS